MLLMTKLLPAKNRCELVAWTNDAPCGAYWFQTRSANTLVFAIVYGERVRVASMILMVLGPRAGNQRKFERAK